MQGDAEVEQLSLGGLELRLGVGGSLLDVGSGEHQDGAVGGDLGAGPQDDLVDAPLGAGGDPADFLGDERAEAANLTQHLTLLHAVDPHEVTLNRGGGGFESGEGKCDTRQHHGGEGAVEDPFLAPGF